jgi:hypothetical protein
MITITEPNVEIHPDVVMQLQDNTIPQLSYDFSINLTFSSTIYHLQCIVVWCLFQLLNNTEYVFIDSNTHDDYEIEDRYRQELANIP